MCVTYQLLFIIAARSNELFLRFIVNFMKCGVCPSLIKSVQLAFRYFAKKEE